MSKYSYKYKMSVFSFTASHHEVPLLGPGGGGLLFERQVVVRRRSHETVQDSDADTGRQDARYHGQTQRISNCVNVAINLRHLCTVIEDLQARGNGSEY